MKKSLLILSLLISGTAAADTDLICENKLGLHGASKQMITVTSLNGNLTAAVFKSASAAKPLQKFAVKREISRGSKNSIFAADRGFKLTVGDRSLQGSLKATVKGQPWEFAVACRGTTF